jgi:DNA-binding response OmpR family regulator
MLLIREEKTIELTSKESELLNLLYASANETVERDIILNKVWGDEGDYVGRTLDVYISKLRKKLGNDASIQIKNIRGIGYKLIIEE